MSDKSPDEQGEGVPSEDRDVSFISNLNILDALQSLLKRINPDLEPFLIELPTGSVLCSRNIDDDPIMLNPKHWKTSLENAGWAIEHEACYTLSNASVSQNRQDGMKQLKNPIACIRENIYSPWIDCIAIGSVKEEDSSFSLYIYMLRKDPVLAVYNRLRHELHRWQAMQFMQGEECMFDAQYSMSSPIGLKDGRIPMRPDILEFVRIVKEFVGIEQHARIVVDSNVRSHVMATLYVDSFR